MELSPYVNYPPRPKPICDSHPAGTKAKDWEVTERKWCQNLLLSFGLLCLIQATLNVTLRLTLAKSECSTTVQESQTPPPAPDEPVTQQCNRLRERVRTLEHESSRLENEERELNDQINHLNNQINQLNNKNSELTNQKNNLINQINAANDQNRELSNQMNGLNNQINDLTGKNRKLNDKISKLTMQLKTITVKPVCPDGWWEMRGKCYYLSSQSEREFWDESRSHCQSQGADLVVIHDEQEQRDLHQINGSRELNFWIGLYNDTSSGTFKWVDNTPLTKAFWQDGQPGDGGPNNPENCVEMYNEKPVLSSWNDAPCKRHKRRWVCEKEAR